MNQAITFSTLIMAAGLATAGGVGTVDHDPLPTTQRASTDQGQESSRQKASFKSVVSSPENLKTWFWRR